MYDTHSGYQTSIFLAKIVHIKLEFLWYIKK